MPKWLYDNLLTRWRAGRELKYSEKLEREHLEGLGQHQASKETYNISSQSMRQIDMLYGDDAAQRAF